MEEQGAHNTADRDPFMALVTLMIDIYDFAHQILISPIFGNSTLIFLWVLSPSLVFVIYLGQLPNKIWSEAREPDLGTSIFHFLSRNNWLRDRHANQVELIKTYPGTFPDIKRRYIQSSISTGLSSTVGWICEWEICSYGGPLIFIVLCHFI